MFINTPNSFEKEYLGYVLKDNSYSFALSDISNRNKNNIVLLNGNCYYANFVKVCDTYLFLVGNGTPKKKVDYKKVNYAEKVLSFEYLLQKKDRKIHKLNIPSKMFTITPKERWLTDDILSENAKDIDYIIENIKTHLKGYRAFEKRMRFLCDNENCVGVCEYALSLNMLYDNYIYYLKDTSIDGWIIKYQHDKW